jgi:hypothetical protein
MQVEIELQRPIIGRSAMKIVCTAVMGALLMATAGCSKSQDANRVPVFPTNGTVKLEGKSPKGAWIVLHPKGAGSRSTESSAIKPHGKVGSDGTFELTSYETNDGAPAGEYTVTLELRKALKYPNGNAGPGPNLVPKQYTRSDTSPLLVQIKPGENALPAIIVK